MTNPAVNDLGRPRWVLRDSTPERIYHGCFPDPAIGPETGLAVPLQVTLVKEDKRLNKYQLCFLICMLYMMTVCPIIFYLLEPPMVQHIAL